MTIEAAQAHRLAEAGTIAEEAPARARGEVDIAAVPETVWDALADVSNWPAFRADVTDAVPAGPTTQGSTFTWAANGLPVSSRFALVERPSRLTWSNFAPGMAATCVYQFELTADGGTRIRAMESMDASGIAPDLDDTALEHGIRTWLDGIKAFVEGGTNMRR